MKLFASSRTSRSTRRFGLVLGCVLASGVALAAWAATDDASPHRPPPMPGLMMLPHGPMLDHLLDDVKASPTQRAQTRQIVDAADAELKQDFGAERADHDQMTQLFVQPTVDPAAIEAVRARIQARHDADSRRMTQAMVDVAQVLTADQRQRIAQRLAEGPRAFGGPHPGGHEPFGGAPPSAPAVNE